MPLVTPGAFAPPWFALSSVHVLSVSKTNTAQVVCASHALQHLLSVALGSVAIVMLFTIFHLKSFS